MTVLKLEPTTVVICLVVEEVSPVQKNVKNFVRYKGSTDWITTNFVKKKVFGTTTMIKTGPVNLACVGENQLF